MIYPDLPSALTSCPTRARIGDRPCRAAYCPTAGSVGQEWCTAAARLRGLIPAEPGKLLRYDCEYKRNGTAKLFVFLDAHRSWRKVKVTERRTANDFAQCMRDLVDIHYPQAPRIRVVLDNLSTHTPAHAQDAAEEAHTSSR